MKKLYTVVIALAAVTLAACGGRGTGRVDTAGEAGQEVKASVSAAAQVVALSDSLITYRKADTISFGRVKSGEILTRTLTIRNDGETPLVIIEMDRSCGCLTLDYPRRPLKAGEEAPFEIEFDSRGLTGWFYKNVYVRTSSDAGDYTLVVTANVE